MQCTDFLPLDLAKKVLVEAANRNVSNISFSGGEPLLYPYFYELYDFVTRDLSRAVTLITNASLLKQDFIDQIVGDHTILQLTLDGHTSELHGKSRDRRNFADNIAVIEYLLEKHQYQGIHVRINISHYNIENVEDIVDFLYALGIRQITVALASTTGRGIQIDKQESIYQLPLLLKLDSRIKNLKKKYIDLSLFYYAFGECLGCDFYSDDAYTMNLRIRYDGMIFPCQSFNCQEANLGNIRNVNIGEAAFEESFDAWVEQMVEKKEEVLHSNCQGCYCRPFCKGGCMAYILDSPTEKTMFSAACQTRKKLYKDKLLML